MCRFDFPFSLVLSFAIASANSSGAVAADDDHCKLATGAFDPQAAASNLITTCEVLESIDLVQSGRVVRLGRDYEIGIPIAPGRTYDFEQKMPANIPDGQENSPRPTVGPFGENRLIANEGFLRGEIDQIGTQFDGPGHVGRARAEDPRRGRYFLNLPVQRVNATPAEPDGGLRLLGVEHIKPIVTRGILIDLAPFGRSECAGQPCWDVGEEITLRDVEAALETQDLDESEITRGDAVFFNSGWGELWLVDNERFNSGSPGIGLEVARWLAAKKVILVGADTWAGEVVPNPNPLLVFPVHQFLLMDNGIFLHEILEFDELIEEGVYKFMYVYVPVPIKGATGSPGSPIALF